MPGADLFLVYIHGFNSSPLSLKARQTVDWFVRQGRGDAIAVPELSHEPARAMADLCEIIANRPQPVALIGSSLGGYYATWLAERFGLRAALLLAENLGGKLTAANDDTGAVFRLVVPV